jgi:hypothetical protein
MINLRYHIISLVAVFLALGLGILMGSTVIDQGLVKDLQRRTNDLDRRLTAQRTQNDALTRQQDLWENFGRETFSRFTHGRLAGRSVALLIQSDANTAMIDGISQSLADAGATIEGRLTLTAKWDLSGEPAREQLALTLGVSGSGDDDLPTEAAGRLAGRLGQSRDPKGRGDFLAALKDAGFLTLEASVESFPSPGALIVVVPTGLKDAKPVQQEFFIPLLKALSPARKVAVVEPLTSAESLADRIRGDGDLRLKVATVDDGDITLGKLALVFALRSLAANGVPSHFGARRSATALVPDALAA